MSSPKCYVFDIGNVVWYYPALQRQFLTTWAGQLNLTYDQMFSEFVLVYQQLETGHLKLSDWALSLGGDLDKFIASLDQVYSLPNFNHHLISTTINFINQLRSENLPLGYLSNVEEFLYPYIHQRLEHLFDFHILSYQVGVRKPHPQIYQEIFKYGPWQPSEVIFFDDTLSNVTAAKELGINAVHFHDTPDFYNQFSLK